MGLSFFSLELIDSAEIANGQTYFDKEALPFLSSDVNYYNIKVVPKNYTPSLLDTLNVTLKEEQTLLLALRLRLQSQKTTEIMGDFLPAGEKNSKPLQPTSFSESDINMVQLDQCLKEEKKLLNAVRLANPNLVGDSKCVPYISTDNISSRKSSDYQKFRVSHDLIPAPTTSKEFAVRTHTYSKSIVQQSMNPYFESKIEGSGYHCENTNAIMTSAPSNLITRGAIDVEIPIKNKVAPLTFKSNHLYQEQLSPDFFTDKKIMDSEQWVPSSDLPKNIEDSESLVNTTKMEAYGTVRSLLGTTLTETCVTDNDKIQISPELYQEQAVQIRHSRNGK